MKETHGNVGVLVEHYRDTCDLTRARERRRERLLIILGVLIALLLLLSIDDTRLAEEVLRAHISSEVLRANLAFLKGAIASLLVLLLQAYYQTDALIERSYPYIHALERRINDVLGSHDFAREGKTYYDNHPTFLWCTWYFYKWIIPISIMSACVVDAAILLEINGWCDLRVLFHGAIAIAVTVMTVMYLRLVHWRK